MMIEPDRYLEIISDVEVRIKGTRVGVEHLLSAYQSGMQPEEIALEFPTLTLEQIHGVIACYLRQRQQFDAYLHQWLSQTREHRTIQASLPPPEVVNRLRTLIASGTHG
jgi:uncharacterized protein (DUF433 family)